MATYITRADLEDRFGVDEIAELLDDDTDNTETSTETQSLTAAIADAGNLIDGYLASRYTLPLSSVPDLVKGWAADIARFKLWDKRAPEEVRKRFDDAIAQLKDLALGRIALPPGSDGEKPTSSSSANITGFSNTRLFTEDTLQDF